MNATYPFREVDLSNWKRARHYAIFADREYPFLGVTTELDISAWDDARLRSGRKFFCAFLHNVMLSMNSIENFRYRIENGKVLLCEKIDPAFVVTSPEDELYYFAIAELEDNPEDFDRNVEEAKIKALETRCLDGNRSDLAFVSCMPWFGFSDIIQPMWLKSPDSIPRVVWGKYKREGGRASIAFSITGHHGLFDGLHIARLLERIQKGTAAKTSP